MLTLQNGLRPNAEEVAAKVIDGEAILINLANGIYYSMDQVGAFIWELIEGGHSLEAIIAAIRARYEVSPDQAQADVERLAAELCHEQLVAVSPDAPVPPKAQTTAPERLPYVSPVLNVYRDMGDLLALDPPTPGLEMTPWLEAEDA